MLNVLVAIEVGAGRGGVVPGQPAVVLAERIAGHSRLRFGGQQA